MLPHKKIQEDLYSVSCKWILRKSKVARHIYLAFSSNWKVWTGNSFFIVIAFRNLTKVFIVSPYMVITLWMHIAQILRSFLVAYDNRSFPRYWPHRYVGRSTGSYTLKGKRLPFSVKECTCIFTLEIPKVIRIILSNITITEYLAVTGLTPGVCIVLVRLSRSGHARSFQKNCSLATNHAWHYDNLVPNKREGLKIKNLTHFF